MSHSLTLEKGVGLEVELTKNRDEMTIHCSFDLQLPSKFFFYTENAEVQSSWAECGRRPWENTSVSFTVKKQMYRWNKTAGFSMVRK